LNIDDNYCFGQFEIDERLMSDTLLFAKEETDEQIQKIQGYHKPWKVAVIDDEEQVHSVTKLVLRNFSFDGRGLELLHAYSAKEAVMLFKEHDDIAICLLDVVMETDSAGLDVVSKIRDDLHNTYTRIVLRTGQPGQAPEESVIKNYDINDYKDKTELTNLKLHTLVYSCLRAYRDIISLNQTRKGLEQVIHASNNVFHHKFTGEFSRGILQQFSSLMQFDDHAVYAIEDGFTAHSDKCGLKIIEGIGKYSNSLGKGLANILPENMLKELQSQTTPFMSIHSDDGFLASNIIDNKDSQRNVLYMQKLGESSALQRKLLDVFSNNVLTAFQNLYLLEDIEKAQREMVYLLAEAVESRSKETGFHLQRVAELSSLLAKGLGLDEDLVLKIYRSSPLHDLGKIAISDNILNKPGKLIAEEFKIMKTHSQIGHDMIVKSERELCQTGRVIALEHHERWDGNGYPNGKKGEDISIEGRIVAVADVFDALSCKRCYKEAWQLDDVFSYMEEGSGRQFDPGVIKVLSEYKTAVREIYEEYSEK
jgi:response regulator RpfG family c-di-GMP phosphodiesterase